MQLADFAMKTYGLKSDDLQARLTKLECRLPNWPDPRLFFSSYRMLSIFSIAGLCYGGLHLFAWNTAFPDTTTKYFWRVSAIFIASSGILIPWMFVKRHVDDLRFTKNLPFVDDVLYCFNAVWRLMLFAWFGLYVVARAFLVVECFINLAHLPDSAFLAPQWSQYFPHIV